MWVSLVVMGEPRRLPIVYIGVDVEWARGVDVVRGEDVGRCLFIYLLHCCIRCFDPGHIKGFDIRSIYFCSNSNSVVPKSERLFLFFGSLGHSGLSIEFM